MMHEQTLLFGKHQSLVGILTEPQHIDPSRPAVILLNGGLVHRVGPHRLYVQLARALAQQGTLVLRFDMSGIGDSKVRADNLPFEKSTLDDTRQAMDTLEDRYGVRTFYLMGHCAGAINSLRTAAEDPRVTSIVMLNPEGGARDWDEYDRQRKEAQYYKTYYGKTALRDASRWKKLLTGQADYRSIARNVFRTIILNQVATLRFKLRNSTTPAAPDPVGELLQSLLHSLIDRGTRVLFIYSEGSTGLERLESTMGRDLRERVAQGDIQLEILEGVDHNYTLHAARRRVIDLIGAWSLVPVADV
jgi:pimeloyl-ACP methyl ester carboxylesterase